MTHKASETFRQVLPTAYISTCPFRKLSDLAFRSSQPLLNETALELEPVRKLYKHWSVGFCHAENVTLAMYHPYSQSAIFVTDTASIELPSHTHIANIPTGHSDASTRGDSYALSRRWFQSRRIEDSFGLASMRRIL